MITFTIDDRQFRSDMERFREQSGSKFKIAVLRATLKMEKLAKILIRDSTRNSRVKTGYLMNRIHKRFIDQNKAWTGEVISGAKYSLFVEEGTMPHPIGVVNKKVLAGPYRGRPPGWKVSAKSKRLGYATYGKYLSHGHPGTKPQPFMYPAWKFACRHLEKLIKQALQ